MISRELFVVDLTVEGCPCQDETLRGLQIEHSKLLFWQEDVRREKKPRVCAWGGGVLTAPVPANICLAMELICYCEAGQPTPRKV